MDIKTVITIRSLKIPSIHLNLSFEMLLTRKAELFFFLTCPLKAKNWIANFFPVSYILEFSIIEMAEEHRYLEIKC